jgi:hypothetical protein
MPTKYSVWRGLSKVLVQAFIFGLPIMAQALPAAWMNITLSGFIALIVNYLKVQNNIANI